jgi:hypothetical protein
MRNENFLFVVNIEHKKGFKQFYQDFEGWGPDSSSEKYLPRKCKALSSNSSTATKK